MPPQAPDSGPAAVPTMPGLPECPALCSSPAIPAPCHAPITQGKSRWIGSALGRAARLWPPIRCMKPGTPGSKAANAPRRGPVPRCAKRCASLSIGTRRGAARLDGGPPAALQAWNRLQGSNPEGLLTSLLRTLAGRHARKPGTMRVCCAPVPSARRPPWCQRKPWYTRQADGNPA